MTRSLIRQFWGFFVIAIKSSFRSPSAIFFGFFFPLIFIFSFAFFDNSAVRFEVGVTRTDVPQYSAFSEVLDKSNIFKITYGTKDDLLKTLQKGDLDAVVSYSGEKNVVITTNASKAKNNEAVIQTLLTVNDKISLAGQPPVYNIQKNSLNGRSGKYIDFVLPGILGFSILSAAIAGTSYSFVSLKKTLTLKRLFATPAKSAPFILGQSLARILVSLSQNFLLLIVAMVFFGYAPQNGFIGVLQMLVVVIFGLIVFLGIGYVVAGVANSDDQVGPLSNILSLPQFLLAGTFFPISGLPQWLQYIAKLLPLYNFNEAMRYVSLDGQTLWSPEVSLQLLFLTLWAVVIYFVASKVFNVKPN